MRNQPNKQGIKVTCPHCSYSWKSKAKLGWITCPSCQKKARRKQNEERE